MLSFRHNYLERVLALDPSEQNIKCLYKWKTPKPLFTSRHREVLLSLTIQSDCVSQRTGWRSATNNRIGKLVNSTTVTLYKIMHECICIQTQNSSNETTRCMLTNSTAGCIMYGWCALTQWVTFNVHPIRHRICHSEPDQQKVKMTFCISYCCETIIFQYAIVTEREYSL